MRNMIFAILALAIAAGAALGQVAEAGADAGAVRMRSGDVDGAVAAWTEALETSGEDLSERERARLAYNLGVAEFGRGEPLLAVAWFESALRLSPRFTDAAVNLEVARAEAGLPPRRADDLAGMFTAAAASVTRPEAEWLALAGALLFALVALGEALRGGRAWRRAVWLALLVQPLFFAPLVRHLLVADAQLLMVVDDGGAPLWSAPGATGERVGTADAGEIVQSIDALPGWTRVAVDGEDRWTRSERLFALRR